MVGNIGLVGRLAIHGDGSKESLFEQMEYEVEHEVDEDQSNIGMENKVLFKIGNRKIIFESKICNFNLATMSNLQEY